MHYNRQSIILKIVGSVLCVLSIFLCFFLTMIIHEIDLIALLYYCVPIIGLVGGVIIIRMSEKIMFSYKGYYGDIHYSRDDKVFYGKILYIKNALITYEAEDFNKLEHSFQEAVDDYLKFNSEFKLI